MEGGLCPRFVVRVWGCSSRLRRFFKHSGTWSRRSKSVLALGMSRIGGRCGQHNRCSASSAGYQRTAPSQRAMVSLSWEGCWLLIVPRTRKRGLYRVSASSQLIDRNFTHGSEYREMVVAWLVVLQILAVVPNIVIGVDRLLLPNDWRSHVEEPFLCLATLC